MIPGVPAGLGAVCQACNEQAVASDFLTDLNAGGETVPGIQYTVIQTRYDDVVTPYTSAVAQGLVLNALDPAHAKTPSCVFVPPVIG